MRALILSGGGVRSAHQLGVLKYLIKEQKKSWDIIAGISAGALSGSYLSQYKPHEQIKAIDNLENLWRSIEGNHSVYKSWFPKLIPSFLGYFASLWLNGLFNTSPLRKLIKNNFSQRKLINSGNKLFIGAVSAQTGKYHFARETDDNLLDWIMASSAFPVVFPPVEINDDIWIDGGIRKNIDILTQILVYQPKEVDIIITTPINGKIMTPSKNRGGALGIAVRAIQISNEESIPTHFIESCIEKGIKVNIYAPKENLGIDILNFSPILIDRFIKKGYDETKELFEGE